MADRRRSGFAGAVVVIIVLIVVVILILIPGIQNLIKGLFLNQERYPEYAVFSVERTLEIEASGGRVANFTIDTSYPTNMSENGYELQEVQQVTYTPPCTSAESRYGIPWMVWDGGNLVGQETYTVGITYDVKTTTHFWNYQPNDVLNVSDMPASMKKYLNDEWKTNVSSPLIQSQSASIIGGEKNVYSILVSIYDWVTANIRYPALIQSSEPQSSVETLQSGVGKCDDQAILFCALSRAAGVPAWLQLGAMYDKVGNAWGGHAWVQTYLPLKSGGGVNVTIDTVNRDFLIWEPNRFADFTDDGNASHLEDYYYTYHYEYDPGSYTNGDGPKYSEDYVAESYQESSRSVGSQDFPISILESETGIAGIAQSTLTSTWVSPVPTRI